MKWFHHDSDFRHKEAIAKLKAEFGFEGIGRYWTICEIIAEQMDFSDKCFAEFPEKKWLSELVIRRPLFRRYLSVIGQLFDNRVITNGSLIRIEMPNLLEKRDNHTRNLQAKIKKLASKDKDKETDKEKPKPSIQRSPKKKSPPDKKTNPELKMAVDYFHDAYQWMFDVKPEITGAHAKIFQHQLKKRSLAELKNLIDYFVRDSDSFLFERAHTIALFPSRIDGYMMALKRHDKAIAANDYQIEQEKVKEAAKIILPKMNGSPDIWKNCLAKLELEILPETFETWFTPTQFLGVAEKILYIQVPNDFFKNCLKNNYLKQIFKNLDADVKTIQLLTEDEYKS